MNNLPKIGEFTCWASGRCNLRCKYCFVYKLYPDQPSSDFQEDLIGPMLDFMIQEGRKPTSLWWFGGEPLVAWHIIEKFLHTAKKRGLRVGSKSSNCDMTFGITTNLVGLTKKRAKWLGKNKFGILCSIDGVQEKHDRYRVYPNGKGSWKDCWKALKLVRRYIMDPPQMRWSFSPETVKGVAKDIEWYMKQGLTNVAVDPIYEVKWTEEDYDTFRKEMLKLRESAIKWYRGGKGIFLKPVRDGIAPLMRNMRGWQNRCGLGQGGVGVDIDGTIYPCHRFVASRSTPIGHITTGFTEQRLKWIQDWKKSIPVAEDPEMCVTCPYRSVCMGGCLAVNYDLFGDPHICPESHCRIHNILAETFMPMHSLLTAEGNRNYLNAYRRGSG